MSWKLLRLTVLLWGIMLSALTLTLLQTRDEGSKLHAMLINSNMRDYDQALYLMTPHGTVLSRLTTFPGGENVIRTTLDGKHVIFRSNVNFNYYSLNIANHRVRELADSISQLLTISFDSRWVYFQRGHSTVSGPFTYDIFRVAIHSGQAQPIMSSEFRYQFVDQSPDGQWLYFFNYGNGEFIRVHTKSNEASIIQDEGIGGFGGIFGWSADGKWMFVEYTMLGTRTLYRMQADGSELGQVLRSGIGRTYDVFNSPNGDSILAQVNDESANPPIPGLYRIGNDESDMTLLGEDVGTWIGWDSDPDWALFLIYTANGTHTLQRLNIHSGERQSLLQNAGASYWWSPNDQFLVFFRSFGISEPNYLVVNRQYQPIQVIPYEQDSRSVTWSPNGEWMYFEMATIQSSELFRINALSGERQSIHKPALHNNHNLIFNGWIRINAASWLGGWWFIFIVGLGIATCGSSMLRQQVRKRYE